MKKTFRLFGLLVMAIVMTISFSACSSDDGPADESNHDPDLVGLWAEKYDSDNTMLFEKNGKFTNEYDDDGDVEWVKGKWSTSDGFLTLKVSSSSSPVRVKEVRAGYKVTSSGLLYIYDEYGNLDSTYVLVE